MVSALDYRSSGPGSSPTLYSWARHLTVVVLLSTQVYKREAVNVMLEGGEGLTLQWIWRGGGGL